MSEARALTNFSGNAVATLVIGHWVDEVDNEQVKRVFTHVDPFDDTDMLDEHHHAADEPVTTKKILVADEASPRPHAAV